MATGALEDATKYFFLAIWETRDDRGVVHRSMPAGYADATTADPLLAIRLRCLTLGWTSRWYYDSVVGIAIYRADAASGTYRRANPHRLTRNIAGNYINAIDYGQYVGEPLYTVSGELENVCPEGFAFCFSHNPRVHTSGHFPRPRCQYSKPFTPGTASEFQVAPQFHEVLGFGLPDGEDAIAQAALGPYLITFSDRAIYSIAGNGPDDKGLNSDFSPLTLISDRIGCDDARSVVSFPGGVMFLGNGTLHVLTHQLELRPIGEAVREQLAAHPTIVSADCLPERFQVLFAAVDGSGWGRVLVYDYRLDEWVVWKPYNSHSMVLKLQDACVHQGEYYVCENGYYGTEIYKYDTSVWKDDTERFIYRDVLTAHVQSMGTNGWQRVKEWMLSAEYRDEHKAKLTVYNDFSDTASQTSTWNNAKMVAFAEHANAKRIQLGQRAKVQKCQSIQLRYQDEDDSSSTGESSILYGFALRIASKPTLTRVRHDQYA